ncbi:MAG: hypothetical protein WCC66_10045 [Rhizobiaceae bacterium]
MTTRQLAAGPMRTYLGAMRYMPALFLMLLALAITGAPFGMGRMMDAGAGHATMHHAGHTFGTMPGMDHGSTPAHQSSAPHYMVCSACVAAPVIFAETVRMAAISETQDMPDDNRLDGTRFLPPTPPPRA